MRKAPLLTIKCFVCGKDFKAKASEKRKACSFACGVIHTTKRMKRHGEWGSRLHRIWANMLARCRDETRKGYADRGIGVCEEWNSYTTFSEWAKSSGYEEHLEIDRANVNGDYCPTNCRWATRSQQMFNVRKKPGTSSRFRGVSKRKEGTPRQWKVRMRIGGRDTAIGSFRSELLAAFAYDDAAHAHAGEFARLNFPDRVRARLQSAS